ncbi:glutathione S-transferase family protein [Hydrogenophaga pseudoflava]|uniref:glutathione S-transferase family protein n=1 Tax=Hydrogenophaga pseudoflava TaxID=47421 RepID=UPI0027E4F210|nr:glutathione S-transferase [Hydrogenophaga pseudoflava]MDQ7742979.1 glutathione S-transferase [Hydrogenophaga pseudoflava]
MSLIVHHLNNSRSQRLLWMLEELELPYEIRFYERDKATMLAPPELKKVHPLGKSPVLEDGKLKLVETGAICEYLVDKTGQLGPTSQGEGLLQYRQFMHYAEGSLMPNLLLMLAMSKVPLIGGIAVKKVQPMVDVHLDYVEQVLASRPWFAGRQMTAADIMMSFPLEAAVSRAGLGPSRPATMAWLKKIHARPAYKVALEKGGTYDYA